MSHTLIKSKLLRWALERSRISHETVAKRVNVQPEKIELWESGKDVPTFRQAQNLAKTLHVPLGYLFLSTPPEEKLPLPDLRTIRNVEFQSPTTEFLDTLNDILRKRDWYREYLQEADAKPLSFIGRFSIHNKAEQVAEDISYTLGIDESLRQKVSSWEEFLRSSIDAAQTEGILVLRSGIVGNNTRRKLSVEEFRGFAICDEIAPVIFLNSQDVKVAQIFTFAHELAHLWIGESGISNIDFGQPSIEQNRKVEFFCNRIAAELLVPKKQFLKDWRNTIPIEENVYKLVRQYRVSSIVVLRRAFDLRKITRDEYEVFTKKIMESAKRASARIKKRKKAGGDFFATLFARNSSQLVSALVAGVLEGKVLYRDGSRLLGVKVKTLLGIADEMGIR